MKEQNNNNWDEKLINHNGNKKKKITLLIVVVIILGIAVSNPIKTLKHIDKNKFESYNICNRDTFMDKFNYIANQQLAYYNIFDGTDEKTEYYKDQLIYEDNIDREHNVFEEYMTERGWSYSVEGGNHNLTILEVDKKDVNVTAFMKEIRSTDYYTPYWMTLGAGGVEYYTVEGARAREGGIMESYDFENGEDDTEEINNAADVLENSEEESTLKEFVVDINDYSAEACSKLETKNN